MVQRLSPEYSRVRKLERKRRIQEKGKIIAREVGEGVRRLKREL